VQGAGSPLAAARAGQLHVSQLSNGQAECCQIKFGLNFANIYIYLQYIANRLLTFSNEHGNITILMIESDSASGTLRKGANHVEQY
jgi:hypothetical protein